MKNTTKTAAQKEANANAIQLVIGLSILFGAVAYNCVVNGVVSNLINFGY